MKPEIKIYNGESELFKNAAEYICSLINYFINDFNKCTLVLSGGKTPKKLFEILSGTYRESVNWSKVYFFWGDERCVPPDDSESNFRMANEYLLSKINVPKENIFRIPSEKPPAEAAEEYEQNMRSFFGDKSFPSFDIVLLGIGNDGHTASLFPETEVLEIKDKWTAAVYVEKLKSQRITLTYPVFNNSKNILLLADGKSKSDIIGHAYTDKNAGLPVQKINPSEGKFIWFLDKESSRGILKSILKPYS
jgi:6-phosphogluconolactonase